MPAAPIQSNAKPAGSLRAGFVVSVFVHLAGAVLIGAMPRAVHHPGSGLEAVDQVVILEPPAEQATPEAKRSGVPPPEPPVVAERPPEAVQPPEPAPVAETKAPEPRRVRLGSPTSTSDAPTMAWIGFDEFMEHSGPQSVVDQPQLTMDAPGAPGAGLPLPPRPAIEPRPATPDPTLTTLPELPGGPPPSAGASGPTVERPVAAAKDMPLVISERETRPKPEDADQTRPAPSEPERRASAPEPSAPQPAQAPAPTSPPLAEAPQDRREVAAPPSAVDQGTPTVQPKPGQSGSERPPEFPVSDKEIPPPVDPSVKPGAEQPAKPDVPAVPDAEKGDERKEAVEAAAPRPEAPPPSIETGDISQGPRPEADPASANAQPSPASRPVEPAPPNPSAASRPSPAVPPVPPRAAGNGRDGTGILSDRESVAAAIKKAVTVDKWGQPLVAKGLKIRTVRPRFTKYTEITSSGAPVVRLLFDRSGRVRDVAVLRSSGNPDVDRPVVDAAYQWTAEGEELETLRENPPETIAIDVRVIR